MRAPLARAVRRALLGLVASIAVLVPQAANAATATTYTVTFGSGSATMSKYFTGDGSSCLADGSSSYRYEIVTVTVSARSTVSYLDRYDTNDVGVGVFPSGGFNPSSPASGCIVSVDDAGSFTLTGPATYDFVVTAFSSTATVRRSSRSRCQRPPMMHRRALNSRPRRTRSCIRGYRCRIQAHAPRSRMQISRGARVCREAGASHGSRGSVWPVHLMGTEDGPASAPSRTRAATPG